MQWFRAHPKNLQEVVYMYELTECLFLFYYEYSCMRDLIRDNLCMAKRFNHTVRYIDDLHVLSLNNTMCEREICNIYPPELTLKKTTENVVLFGYFD